jgi:ubiquinone/menaquinone biosynthesis C-methylase UbiE
VSIKAHYGNWVPQNLAFTFLAVSVLLFIGGLFLDNAVVRWILFALSALCLLFFLYLAYAYYLLATGGSRLQRQFYALVINNLSFRGGGKALDIGTGNGALAIELAKRHPSLEVVGVDLWGKPWSYSQESCESNAVLEGVADRTSFVRAGAESLGFEDEYFDVVVSNFVFHTVKTDDRMSLLKEAVRVLKKGGHFSLVDLFNSEFYEEPQNLADVLKSWGLQEVRFVETSQHIRIPLPLKVNHMLGGSGVLFGTK